MRKCTKCGHEADGIWFCPNCGEAMQELNDTGSVAQEIQANTASETEIKKKGFFTSPITRTQYWIRTLVTFFGGGLVVGLGLEALLAGIYIPINSNGAVMPAYYIGDIVIFVLLIIFEVQRLHDANKSALWLLLNLIPGVGFIVAIIVPGCFKSNYENNKWV